MAPPLKYKHDIEKYEYLRNQKKSWSCISKIVGVPEDTILKYMNYHFEIRFVPKKGKSDCFLKKEAQQ